MSCLNFYFKANYHKKDTHRPSTLLELLNSPCCHCCVYSLPHILAVDRSEPVKHTDIKLFSGDFFFGLTPSSVSHLKKKKINRVCGICVMSSMAIFLRSAVKKFQDSCYSFIRYNFEKFHLCEACSRVTLRLIQTVFTARIGFSFAKIFLFSKLNTI